MHLWPGALPNKGYARQSVWRSAILVNFWQFRSGQNWLTIPAVHNPSWKKPKANPHMTHTCRNVVCMHFRIHKTPPISCPWKIQGIHVKNSVHSNVIGLFPGCLREKVHVPNRDLTGDALVPFRLVFSFVLVLYSASSTVRLTCLCSWKQFPCCPFCWARRSAPLPAHPTHLLGNIPSPSKCRNIHVRHL